MVFFGLFLVVSGLRTWWAGGDPLSVLPGYQKNSETFRPESFTLPEAPALKLSDVELLTSLNREYAALTQAVVPSVVSINTMGNRTERLLDGWGRMRVRQYPTQGQGSGVIVTAEGHVVTNHHVIAGQQQIQVTMHDGQQYRAKLIGEDNLLDIAVLKIDSKKKFTPLKLGDSEQVQVGQLVFAVGNPFGLGETVTQGIISAKERSISDNQRDLLQTDAAINPGNSGGPLVNLQGEIIGINVAIFSADRANPGFQGVGFSIPANDVKDALQQILERGRPIRGYLGVQMRDLDSAVRSILGYQGDHGTAVAGVLDGSPAQQAGLRANDMILAVDGQKIANANQLFSIIQRTRIGSVVNLEVWRAGQIVELQATIAESGTASPAKSNSQQSAPRSQNSEWILATVGIQARDLSAQEQSLGLIGVVVTELSEAGIAAEFLAAGDLLVSINGVPITDRENFFSQLASSAAAQNTSIELIRQRQKLRFNLPLISKQ